MLENARETRNSDEGYNTDQTSSPTISPTKDSLNIRLINKESKEFRSKYFTTKILNNSANGVIYQGTFTLNFSDTKLIIQGYRLSDNYPVAIKQVPRSRIPQFVNYEDRNIPLEFLMHIKASKCDGVVKVRN